MSRVRGRFQVGEMVFLSPYGVPLWIGHEPEEIYRGITSVGVVWVHQDGAVCRARFNQELIYSEKEVEQRMWPEEFGE